MAIKGLDAIKKKAAEKKGFTNDGPLFLQIKDGESTKLRFMQELEETSPNYDERRGLAQVIEEHASPKDFKRTAACTAEDEGRCWACEQTSNPEIGKKWKPRMRLYTNVLVRGKDGGEDKVMILKAGFSDKGIGDDVVNIAEEFGALGDKDVKYSRKGSGMNDTSYSLLPLAPKPLSKDEQTLELHDINKFIKRVSYDEQPAFYAGATEETSKAKDWISD